MIYKINGYINEHSFHIWILRSLIFLKQIFNSIQTSWNQLQINADTLWVF